MASTSKKFHCALPTKVLKEQIKELIRLNKLIGTHFIASKGEKFDFVCEVLFNVLNADVEPVYNKNISITKSMTITDEKAGTPKTNQDTFNEATLKEMCGKVTDQIRQYFCSNCECVTEYEPDTIKQMMEKHKQSMKLYKELSTVVTKLGDELIKSPKDFMLSVKRASYAKTTSTQFVEYPMRVDQDPPIVVLGPHGTEVPVARYSKIRWNTPQGAARMLCALVFDRNTILMTNFSDILLDPYKVSDIEYCIKANTKATSEEIHKAIAKKCHDTHVKFMKYRLSHGVEF